MSLEKKEQNLGIPLKEWKNKELFDLLKLEEYITIVEIQDRGGKKYFKLMLEKNGEKKYCWKSKDEIPFLKEEDFKNTDFDEEISLGYHIRRID